MDKTKHTIKARAFIVNNDKKIKADIIIDNKIEVKDVIMQIGDNHNYIKFPVLKRYNGSCVCDVKVVHSIKDVTKAIINAILISYNHIIQNEDNIYGYQDFYINVPYSNPVIKITRINNDTRIKCIADVRIDNYLCIKNIKLLYDDNKLKMEMPQKIVNKIKINQINILNADLYERIYNTICTLYQRTFNKDNTISNRADDMCVFP